MDEGANQFDMKSFGLFVVSHTYEFSNRTLLTQEDTDRHLCVLTEHGINHPPISPVKTVQLADLSHEEIVSMPQPEPQG